MLIRSNSIIYPMIMHSMRDDTYVVRRIDIDKPRFMLGFTPLEEGKDKCISEVYDGGDDYRLFYMGKKLESIEQDKLYFPDLSHA